MMNKQQLNGALDQLGKDHEYMSDEQYQLFKQHLLTLRSEKVTQREEEEQRYLQLDFNAPDPSDKATANEEQEKLLPRISGLKADIQDIDNALKAIQEEEYGFCKSCGEEIGLKRLLARPASLRDTECETIHEENIKKKTGRRAFNIQ